MWNHTKKGKKIEFGRELTPKERAKEKIKNKPINQMSQTELKALVQDMAEILELI